MRAAPTPVHTLGKPGKFTVTLDETGALALKWKCANPRASGTVYQVWRRIGAQGEFVFLGSVGRKRFTDSTLPAAAPAITYQIQAVRSTAAGPRAQFNVNFGTSGGGITMASVFETPPCSLRPPGGRNSRRPVDGIAESKRRYGSVVVGRSLAIALAASGRTF